jgi:hypothetical protein
MTDEITEEMALLAYEAKLDVCRAIDAENNSKMWARLSQPPTPKQRREEAEREKERIAQEMRYDATPQAQGARERQAAEEARAKIAADPVGHYRPQIDAARAELERAEQAFTSGDEASEKALIAANNRLARLRLLLKAAEKRGNK